MVLVTHDTLQIFIASERYSSSEDILSEVTSHPLEGLNIDPQPEFRFFMEQLVEVAAQFINNVLR